MKYITILMLSLVLAGAALAQVSKPETGRIAVIETSKGTIKFALYEKDAPITTANFIELANKKFYDGLKFHRVVPGFVIQGGDPNGNGSGGSGKTIKLETSPKLKHDAAGVVAMARSSNPDSASSQFYITLDATPNLDGGYAVFGRVTVGLDVVKKIQQGDTIKTIRIIPKPEPKENTDKTEDKKPAEK
ncbi:MAG: peptidylprolyl isomerase [Armatimonadetes bacterium]|nr:peptidylprolyl isomerase [Armatimonadota bacterium]